MIDLIEQRAIYNVGEDGEEVRFDSIPAQFRAEAEDMRAKLIGNGCCFSLLKNCQ